MVLKIVDDNKMITVAININGNCIMAKSCHNISDNDDGTSTYKTDCGKLIKHNPDDGAIKLAHKLLDCLDASQVDVK